MTYAIEMGYYFVRKLRELSNKLDVLEKVYE